MCSTFNISYFHYDTLNLKISAVTNDLEFLLLFVKIVEH